MATGSADIALGTGELKRLDARRADENFVLFELLFKPDSVGGPPRPVQISRSSPRI